MLLLTLLGGPIYECIYNPIMTLFRVLEGLISAL